MSDPKVTAAHLRRAAAVYCRQSTLIQVERNRESTLRQYDLVSRAGALGWPRSAIRVIDADLGVSGSGLAARAGFTELTEQIALGQVGVVLALEVSRLARSSAEWYRLLDLCGITDTLIADEASVYHPGMFDDRLLLGLKGTMAEAELQVLRARMLGGLRNKAARGELRIPLPAGLVWGEAPGQILLHPDEAVRGAITAVFDRFAASGSARQVWLWLRENGLKLPSLRDGQLAWATAAYPAVHKILTHPAYAGAYVYGRTRAERYIDASGSPAGKRRAVPRPEDWQVLITGHHPGYIELGHLPGQHRPAGGEHGPGPRRRRDRRDPGGLRAAAGPGDLRDLRAPARRVLPRPRQVHPRLPVQRRRAGRRRAGPVLHQGQRPAHRPGRRPARPGGPHPARAASRDRRRGPDSRPGTTPRWISGAARPSRPATPPPGPSAATAPSTRKTGWSPAAWKPNGKPRCRPPATPKPSWTAAKRPGPSGSAPTSAPRSSPSPPTCPRCGPRRRPPTATARNSCTPSSTTSSSPPMRPAAPPASCCTGKEG